MENNEIMNYEGTEVMESAVTGEKTGLSTGGKVLIGAGVFLAVTAGIKLARKVCAAHKAKKEARLAEEQGTYGNEGFEVVDE